MPNTLKTVGEGTNVQHVKFNLPGDKVIQYIQENKETSYLVKLNSVVKTISSVDTEDILLVNWMNEFKDNILFLEKNKEAIVSAVLNLRWYVKDESFVAVFQELILNLVTAHPFYLRNVLSMVIHAFLTIGIDKDNRENYSETEKKSLQNVHSLAQHITKLIPLSQFTFCTLLLDRFPYIKRESCLLLHYVENMLTVCSYLPNKRNLILACIIEKLIQMDVLCSKENIEIYELRKEEQDTSAHMDIDNASNSEVKLEKMAFPMAHTLDTLMNSMFTYIRKTCFTEDEQLNWESTKKLYKEILTIFDKIILPTHGSCHVQYLLFYICNLKQELCDGFLDYLWKKVQNPNAAPVLRQISAFYIGSFLSRAKYINISTVTACFDLMCQWIHRYIDAHTSQDLDVHGTFHSVCQTIFYVFAFRSKELLEMKDGYKYLRSLNFDRIVSCRLNPLRFLDRSIVQNFASISRNHQIAYVYPIIEKNNRNLLYSCFESSSEEYAAGAMIPTFFPFDPYLLKRSKHWIELHYRIYNHVCKDEETIDQIEDDEMCVNDERFSYSMSPGFKKNFVLRHN